MSLKPQPSSVRSAVSPLRPLLPAPGAELAWAGLYGSSRGLAIAQAAEAHSGPILLVTRTTRRAI